MNGNGNGSGECRKSQVKCGGDGKDEVDEDDKGEVEVEYGMRRPAKKQDPKEPSRQKEKNT